ncbi:MAG: hypothetical protein QM778_26455 [Myxococcales bacterium]
MRGLRTVLIAAAMAGAASLGVLGTPAQVRADRVFLSSGSMIEGKATRVGEKVIVEMEAGYITVSAGSVQRIEKAQSEVEYVEARLKALAPTDVQGLLLLADYCRDRNMKAREEDMLRRVIALAPDNTEARARLGYVRTEAGWVTRDEQMRAQGLIKHEGRWLTQEQYLAVQRLEAETRIAQLQREQAQVDLDAKRAELASKRSQQAYLEREREDRAASKSSSYNHDGLAAYYGPYYGYGSGFYPYPAGARAAHDRHLPNPMPPPGPGPAPSPIPGFRDPSNMSFQVPGYQDPRNYFR